MIAAIWQSFRRLPGWVQGWVALILVPVNLASLWFWAEPGGIPIALLAVGAMALNGVIMLAERGFSKAMAWPHLALWIPLVAIVAAKLAGGAEGDFRRYLALLLAVDTVSLGFDIPDAIRWLRGARGVA